MCSSGVVLWVVGGDGGCVGGWVGCAGCGWGAGWCVGGGGWVCGGRGECVEGGLIYVGTVPWSLISLIKYIYKVG